MWSTALGVTAVLVLLLAVTGLALQGLDVAFDPSSWEKWLGL
jgi:hypothetical protein